MNARELIAEYGIQLAGAGMMKVHGVAGRPEKEINTIKAEIMAQKPEILAILEAEKKAAEAKEAAKIERDAKIDSIPGLKEMEAAIRDEQRYAREFDKMMEDGKNDGANPPKAPKADSEELRRQYPRAAAYMKAEDWELSEHYAQAAAGRKAKERIINGEDYVQVLEDMKREWNDYIDNAAAND